MFQGLIMVVRSAIAGVIITYTVCAEENTFIGNAVVLIVIIVIMIIIATAEK